MDSSFVLRTLGTNDSVHLISPCVPGVSIRRAMQKSHDLIRNRGISKNKVNKGEMSKDILGYRLPKT